MSLKVKEFLFDRIDEIMQELKNTNGEYAVASDRGKELFGSILPIIQPEKDIAISGGDCVNINEYLDQEFTREAVSQMELYKQGYLDCVKLLSILEVIG